MRESVRAQDLPFERLTGFLESFTDETRPFDLCLLLRSALFGTLLRIDVRKALALPPTLRNDVLVIIATPPRAWPYHVVDFDHFHCLIDIGER